MRDEIYYEDTCEVNCTDNGNTITAEILNFVPESFLSVSVNRAIKLNLTYNPTYKEYVGSNAGLEFISKGPAEVRTNLR
jgi:poly(A) polymerase Pap1